jgi:hypothetical protein
MSQDNLRKGNVAIRRLQLKGIEELKEQAL